MAEAISNTSPFLYLFRVGALEWLPRLFGEVWVPDAVAGELRAGQEGGFTVPRPEIYSWVRIVNAQNTPSQWLALDLGAGELAAMALALEHPERIVLLDDAQARRVAKAAGLTVWGTLKVLLEGKACGLTESIAPWLDRLLVAGMWLDGEIRRRVLALAGEGQ